MQQHIPDITVVSFTPFSFSVILWTLMTIFPQKPADPFPLLLLLLCSFHFLPVHPLSHLKRHSLLAKCCSPSSFTSPRSPSHCSPRPPPTRPPNNVVIIASSVAAGVAGYFIILVVVIVLAVIHKKHKKTQKPK